MSRSKCRPYIKKGLVFLLPFFILFFAACSDDQGSATIGEFTLEADPETLPADGRSQANIEAELKLGNGDEVPDDTPVRFKIISGGGKITEYARTVEGFAIATLTSSRTPGTAIIEAESRGRKATIRVTFKDDVPAYIEIAEEYPFPTPVDIVGTGGKATSRIVLNVLDVHGEPVPDGYRIDFEILEGPDGGEILEPTSATTTTVEGDADEPDGLVSTIFRSGIKPGPVKIKASYRDNPNVFTIIDRIAVNAGPPVGEEFGLSADYRNISGLRTAHLRNSITANAADVYGNAVPDGTAIAFRTYNTGGFISSFENIQEGFTGTTADGQEGFTGTTADGMVTAWLHSPGTYLPPINGFVSVTAEAEGGPSTHVTSIAVDPQDSKIVFVGTSGGGVYKSRDAGSTWENVSRTTSSLNPGQNFIDPYVNDIWINPDNPDMIYAATGYAGRGNIYRSLDGGLTWNSNNSAEWNGLLTHHENASLFGSAVLTVMCDEGSDYVWAGTQDKGAFFSSNGRTFTQGDGLGQAKTVRDISKASGTGNSATLYAGTREGVYKTTNGGSTWTKVTDFTGDNITAVIVHPDDDKTIFAGTQERGVWYSTNGGNSWIRTSINDPDLKIKDLQVYHNVTQQAYYLYAIDYYEGAHRANATGNVYVVALNAGSNYRPIGSWRAVSRSLPEREDWTYITDDEPPIDTTLFAQHAMAVDLPRASRSLYIGGQGISLHKATSGLSDGDPVWVRSQNGLSNLIMARMPVLFTGESHMEVDIVSEETIGVRFDEVTQEEVTQQRVTFEVYIQDRNGNPPIAGSTFEVVQEVADGDDIVWRDIEYGDVYRHSGTWFDLTDPNADNPFVIDVIMSEGDKMIFTFTPTCDDSVPGCSGQERELTYFY